MSRPVLYAVTPFDATQNYSFKFSYTGNQAVKNKLLIKNNSTLQVVYEQEQTTFQLEHTIAANVLTNGTTYSAQIKIYDVNNNETDYSTEIIFICLTTPSFTFSNLVANQVIHNVIYEISLSYTQAQGEPLDSFYIVLYDNNNQMLFQSPTSYSVNDLTYTLEALDNGNTYHIRAFGQTVRGVPVSTARIPFTVEYLQPNVFSVVQVENKEIDGTVNVKSNLILVDGKYDGIPVYINGQQINLQNGVPVIYDEGFSITPDFSLQVKLSDFNLGKPIIAIDDKDIVLLINKANIYGAYAGQYYAQLLVKSGLYTYVIFSNYFSSKNVMINMRRLNGVFSLRAMEVSA